MMNDELRRSASRDALFILSAAPNNYLILLPDAPKFTIVAVTDAYLKATYTEKDKILHKGIFEVFPDNPHLSNADGVKNLSASLNYVLENKTEHRMAEQRYDVINAEQGEFAFKVWRPLNKPVLDNGGEVQYIIHSVEDITESATAHKQVKETSSLLKSVFDSSANSIGVYNILANSMGEVYDLEVEFFNAFTEKTKGFTTAQVKGKRYRELFPELIGTGIFEKLKTVATTGQSVDFEDYHQEQGKHHWYRFIAVKSDGLLIVITENITLRKESEEALRQSEDRLQKAMSIETVGVLFFSLDGTMSDANHAFLRMIGYSREDLLTRIHWKVFTPPEYMEVTARAAEQLAAYGETAPYEKELIRKDGSRWWALCAPKRLSGTGKDSLCVEFILDITERKHMEEQLRRNEERLEQEVQDRTTELKEEHYFLEQVTNNTPHLIYVFDLDEQRFIYINQRIQELTGIQQEYVYGMGLHLFKQVIHPDDLARRIDYLFSLVTLKKNEIRENEFRVKVGDSYHWFRSKDHIFKTDDNNVTQIIGLAEDITYEKMLHEKIQNERGNITLN